MVIDFYCDDLRARFDRRALGTRCQRRPTHIAVHVAYFPVSLTHLNEGIALGSLEGRPALSFDVKNFHGVLLTSLSIIVIITLTKYCWLCSTSNSHNHTKVVIVIIINNIIIENQYRYYYYKYYCKYLALAMTQQLWLDIMKMSIIHYIVHNDRLSHLHIFNKWLRSQISTHSWLRDNLIVELPHRGSSFPSPHIYPPKTQLKTSWQPHDQWKQRNLG